MQVMQPMKETSEEKHSQAFKNVKMMKQVLSKPLDIGAELSHPPDAKEPWSSDESQAQLRPPG